MIKNDVPALCVESNLRLVVDGDQATVEAQGSQITVWTDDVGRFLARVVDSTNTLPVAALSMRHLAGLVGETLDDLGLSARVVGSRGTVLKIGRGAGSRVGRIVLGSNQIGFGSTPAVVRAASGYALASETIRQRLAYTSAGVVLAGLVVGSALRRRPHPPAIPSAL